MKTNMAVTNSNATMSARSIDRNTPINIEAIIEQIQQNTLMKSPMKIFM